MPRASARFCWSAWASVTDPVDIVRAGYDPLSYRYRYRYRYRADDSDEGRYAAWIDTIRTHCAPGGARFIRADLTEVDFDAESFDAIACFYVLIHVPLDRQATLLTRMASWLRPGGSVPMWWSHADATTYRAWLQAAGLRVVFFSAVRGQSPACLPA
jgi:SAM-dependent methyltransferase